MIRVSIIIPAYNEDSTILQILEQVWTILRSRIRLGGP